MIPFLKKSSNFYFLFLLSILTTKLAVVHSHDSILDIENDSVFNEPDTNICVPKLCESTNAFEWSATFLYLKPSVDDSHYVISSFDNTFNGTVFPKGKRHQNCTSFTPGFSVEGLYAIDPNISCVDLRFTYFTARSTDSVSGDFLYDTNGFPGFGAQDTPIYAGTARSKNSYDFYAGDITYNRTFMDFCPENLIFIVGLHVAYIKFKEHTTSSGTFINNQVVKPLSNNLHRHSQFYGVGPQIGLDYQFLLFKLCRFLGTWAFRMQARGSLLCGNTKSNLRYVTLRTGPGGVGIHNGDLWRVIPEASTEFGINYTLNHPCFSLAVELGYACIWYSKCVNRTTGLDVAFAGDTIDISNSFSLHGPYLRVSSAF